MVIWHNESKTWRYSPFCRVIAPVLLLSVPSFGLSVASAATVTDSSEVIAPTATAVAPQSPEPESPASQSSASLSLHALLDAEYRWQVQDGGGSLTPSGEEVPADRLPSVTPAAQRQRIAHWTASRAALNAIPLADLSDDDRIHAAVLGTLLDASLASASFKNWEMPLNSDSNFWTYLDARGGLLTVADYQRYIAKMRDIPRYFDEQIANMRRGLQRGFSVPRISLERRDGSIASFVTPSADGNAFAAAFTTMPANLPAATQQRLRAEGRAAIEQAVIPAYAKLLRFYRQEYLPKTRTSLSVQDLPQGADFYAAQIKEYTTLDLTADQIHQIGLAEVTRIQAEMNQVMIDSGFKGSFPEFLQFLRTDPQFYAKTPDELMGVSAYVAKRVDGKLAETIGYLPRRRFTILPVPDALAPFYTAGRGGLEACWMNTHNLPSRPLYNIPALTLHECAPGHSLQAALADERKDGPALRRSTYFSGFGEGWGLYTEWLGIGMGIYRTPYEHFGRLSYEMWRAARLVIDTGIHQKDWSRDQAIAYLADQTALSRHEVETEVDRYISWPGQALAYKLGEMTIRRLRADAEAALGEAFDQRKFHDVILSLGSVPLPVLETRIARFIANGGEI